MRPVHTFVAMVMCPVCRSTYMAEGEPCCWRCQPDRPAPGAGELAMARQARLLAEMEVGSAGSLEGLGFAPLEPRSLFKG